MSLNFGYRCNDCNEETMCLFNYGDRFLSEMFMIRKNLYIIRSRTDYSIQSWRGPISEFVDFLHQHEGHKIELIDEYGKKKSVVT